MSRRRDPEHPADRKRRAFGPIGGEVRTRGEPDAAEVLAASWRAATGEGRERTHGFHAYPARMHPGQARVLLDSLAPANGAVLDPFCGSGTVLIETFASGRRAVGTDVNPLALALTHLKSRLVPRDARRAIEESAAAIARSGSRAARSRLDDEDAPAEARRWFAPHVIRELAAIGDGVARVARERRRNALRLVLSSILVKVSRQAAETDRSPGDQETPAGFTSQLFAERAHELGRGLAALERAVPRGTPAPLVARADARSLPVADASIDLVLTSPPYLGTYDYAGTQELRADALGFDLQDAVASTLR